MSGPTAPDPKQHRFCFEKANSIVALDHDAFSSNRAEGMNVIVFNKIVHDVTQKPVPTFWHHALATQRCLGDRGERDTLEQARSSARSVSGASAMLDLARRRQQLVERRSVTGAVLTPSATAPKPMSERPSSLQAHRLF